MSDNPTDTYTVSFKTHAGYEASLIVVRGDSAEELEANLAALSESTVQAVVDMELLVQAALTTARGVQPPVSSEAATGATVTQMPSSDDKFCNHGKREYKSGNKNGKSWAGWFCAAPRGASDKCDPVWKDNK